MLRGKIAKRPKQARKGLSSNLGKKIHQIYQQKKATKKKKKKKTLTLPIPSKPSMKRNQQHIKHTIIQRWRTHRTHAHRNKTKQNIKTSQAPKIKKRYIFTLLGRKYVVLQLLSKCFDIKKQFNLFR